MCKSRTNRNARRKRDKRHLKRLAEKVATLPILRAHNGPNLDYYTLTILPPKTTVVNNVRMINMPKIRYRLMPNQKYRDMAKHLMEMCAGVTVNLSALRDGEAVESCDEMSDRPCPHCESRGYVEAIQWRPFKNGPCRECRGTGRLRTQ